MKFIKSYLFVIISLLIIYLLLGILAYNNFFNSSILDFIALFSTYFIILYSILKLSLNSKKKNLNDGFIFGLIITFSFILINKLFIDNFSLKKIIYYFSLFIISFLSWVKQKK